MKQIILILLLTSSVFGQQVDFKVNGGQKNIYHDAIAHYIDSIYYNDKPTLDTLFILKNEEFTENILPITIKKINICFQDTSNINRRLKGNRHIRALNISADTNLGKDRINILINSFIISSDNKGKPTRSCRIRYYYNQDKKEFEFKNIVCEY